MNKPNVIFRITPDTGKVIYSDDVPAFMETMNPNYVFKVGQDDPADWPTIHPGPEDEYAGNKLYRYTLSFDWKGNTKGLLLLKVKLHGNYFDKSSTKDNIAYLNARFMPKINGREWPWRNKWEKFFSHEMRDWDPNMFHDNTWWATIPAQVLRDGENEIMFSVVKGEGLHYKDIEFVHYEPGIHIEALESTIFYKEIDGVLHNLVRAHLLKTEEKPAHVQFDWSAGGKEGTQQMELPFGRHTVEFFVPDSKEGSLDVQTDVTSGEFTGHYTEKLQLRRKWDVMLNHHTHTDIGYTHLPEDIIELQNDNMRHALTCCEQTESWPEESRFVWTVEVSWLIDEFLKVATEEEKGKLQKYLANGQIIVEGLYLNMHSDVLNLEEMIEHTTWKRLGLKADSAMITDVPGYPWSLMEVLGQAGVEYLDVTPNFTMSTRSPNITTPQLFYWKSPSHQQKILTWYNIYHYFDGNELGFVSQLSAAEHNVSNRLDEMERKGFPFSHYLVRVCGQHSDNSPPNVKIAEIVKEWNAKWAYPKVRMGDAGRLLHSAEEQYGDSIPVVEGELADWWSDGVGSGAKEMAESRQTQVKLQDSKTWGALLDAETNHPYPSRQIADAYKQLLLFDEHTWGFWDSNARQPLHHQSIELKQGYVKQAMKHANEMRAKQKEQFAHLMGANENSIVVFNSLSWDRKEIVKINIPERFHSSAHFEIKDPTSDEVMPSQMVSNSDGTSALWFVATVPALSSKAFHIVAEDKAVRAEQGEHPYFETELDPQSGAIRKWYDKQRKIDLVDDQRWGLGQFVRAEIPRKEWGTWGSKIPRSKPDYETTENAQIVVDEKGPVAHIKRVRAEAPGAKSFTVDYVLYVDRPEMDIIVTMDKEAVDAYELGYIAFPFHSDPAQFSYDLALGKVQFPEQLLPASALDHIAVQSWVNMQQENSGILVITHDAPLAQFGRIRTREMGGVKGSFAELQPHIEELPAHYYSYIYNNLWGTNFWPTQGGQMQFRYTIIPYADQLDDLSANRTGLANRSPLHGVWVEQSNGKPSAQISLSFMSDVSDFVSLETIEKAASDTYIIRFKEIAGQGGNAAFAMKYDIQSAVETSIDETEEQSLPVEQNRVKFAIEAYGMAQIKVKIAQ